MSSSKSRWQRSIAEIAHSYGLRMDTFAEGIELQQYGIEHARCIDGRLLGQLIQCPLDVKKDKNQRLKCSCVESRDIGAYNTCVTVAGTVMQIIVKEQSAPTGENTIQILRFCSVKLGRG